jgi:hypothetical protein
MPNAHLRAGKGVTAVPDFIDPVFGKTSSKRSFSVMQNKRIGLVFPKTGSINSVTAQLLQLPLLPAKSSQESVASPAKKIRLQMVVNQFKI